MGGEKEIGNCVICKKDSTLKCSACCQVYYCSPEHQKKDWKTHKSLCRPFEVRTSEKFGRYLVASRDIKAGEKVMKEAPIFKGPSQITPPVCVGCLENVEEENCLECDRCGWPICSRECQDVPDHKPECDFTMKMRGEKVKISCFASPHPVYQSVSVLRALLLKQSHPDKWEKLMELESHCEQRRGTAQWRGDRASIAQFIPRYFKCENMWTEDEILKVAGILQINGHEIPLTEPPYVAVYHRASFYEHNCIPTIAKSFSINGDVVFWAPRPIKRGEHLSISYTDVVWATPNRLLHLKHTKMFDCECVRCLDTTEMGTYFSALKCTAKVDEKEVCGGYMLPEKFLQLELPWKCEKCSKEYTYSYADNICEHANKDFEAMQKDQVDQCRLYIDHYSKFLAPNHFRLCQARMLLAQLLGSGGPQVIQSISRSDLDQKVKLCQDLLKIFEIVAPTEPRLLGAINFELHAGLAEIGRRESLVQNPNFKGALEDSLACAQATVEYLKHEPNVLPEGQIGTQAKINADSLKILLGIPLNS